MNHLASLKRFAQESNSTIEVVLQDGQKLQFDYAIRANAQQPNKFHAERLGDLNDQEFFYDDRILTLQDGTAGFHATMAAPDTLKSIWVETLIKNKKSWIDLVQDFIPVP